jgi:hypothetical protein
MGFKIWNSGALPFMSLDLQFDLSIAPVAELHPNE